MYEWTGAKSSAPDFDQARADALVGKHILVGVTILSASGELLERSEYHGIIQSASPSGIDISLRGDRAGSNWVMPPHLDAIAPAKPGEYRLKRHWRDSGRPRFLGNVGSSPASATLGDTLGLTLRSTGRPIHDFYMANVPAARRLP